MKRILLPILAIALLGAGLWWALTGGRARAGTAVAALLPEETLAVIHLPDLNRTRTQWKTTDLHALWREPAVQDFLQRPLSRNPDALAPARRLAELEPLEVKDAFVALLPFAERNPRLIGGFRFKGEPGDAEKVLGPWRTQLQQQMLNAKSETITHQEHRIEVLTQDGLTQATVYAGDWFFAGNDLAAVQALLDRLDGRQNDHARALAADEDYKNALRRMPADYAAFGYARVERIVEQLGRRSSSEAAPKQRPLQQVRSVAAATKFEGGKIRDVLFLAMPPGPETGALTRASLALTTANTFLYISSVVQPPTDLSGPPSPGTAAAGIFSPLNRLFTGFRERGITGAEWNSTFSSEFSLIGDWQPEARIPALLATLPVKDTAQAVEILRRLTASTEEESAWTASEREGVQYFTQAPANPMVPVAPTIAVSQDLVIAGLDTGSVGAAMQRAGLREPGIGGVDRFETAQRLVPAAKTSFTYIDLGLLYTRLDAAVRPMLIMAAAFMPGIAEWVDLGRLPPVDVVVRHLSPIVMSQSYDGDGYVIASIGPVSIYGAAVGIAATTGVAADLYRRQVESSDQPDDVPTPTPPVEESPTESPDSEEVTPTPEARDQPDGDTR
ncbi:hypothetical protein BH20VER1_BH20VER1_08350 [soil metagenome]